MNTNNIPKGEGNMGNIVYIFTYTKNDGDHESFTDDLKYLGRVVAGFAGDEFVTKISIRQIKKTNFIFDDAELDYIMTKVGG